MRILIARIGRAGDMVMITPALRAILECYPDAAFTLLTSPDGRRLLSKYSPQIRETWVWDRSSLTASIQKFKLARAIQNSRFDKIICFETSPGIARIFSKTDSELYRQDGASEHKHSAREYLDLAEQMCGKKLEGYYVNLPVTAEAQQRVDNELEQKGISKDDTVIALHPTYSGYSKFNLRKRNARKHKLWPAENFGQLAQMLSQHKMKYGNHPKIIIDLLDDEMPLGKKIVALSRDTITLLNMKPNFERYKALLQRADLLVSPDTGPMHIAAAVNTRIVALFSGKNPADCGPYMEPGHYTVLRAEETSCPELGISAIDTQSVFEACRKQLELM